MTNATKKKSSGTEKTVRDGVGTADIIAKGGHQTPTREPNVGTPGVIIFPRPGETAADLLAVVRLIGFRAEEVDCYGEDET